MAFTLGEWYRPDSSWRDEPPTPAELAEEKAYEQALERGEDADYLPWGWRRAAAAAENLLQAILREFGPGVVVELKGEHDANVSPPMALRYLTSEDGEPVAFLDFADDPSWDVSEPAAALPCSSL